MRSTIIFTGLLLAALQAKSATITASSVAYNDVIAAMALATSGDTVQIPAGSNNWTSGTNWTVPASVILKGAGTSATGGGDQTIIVDNYNSTSPLLGLTLGAGNSFRMTGLTIQSGPSLTDGTRKDSGTLAFFGTNNTQIRIDHCHFNFTSNANYQAIALWGGFGVMDHCEILLGQINGIYTYNGRKSNDTVGNWEWQLPLSPGSADAFYIEDNILSGEPSWTAYQTRLVDANSGSKLVIRFNTIDEMVVYDEHGTGHALNDRGPILAEVYGNAVTSPLALAEPHFSAMSKQTGTGLFFGNTWDEIYKHIYSFHVIRKSNDPYVQTATPGGWGYAGTTFNGVGSMWDGGTALGTDTALGYPALDQPGRGPGDLIVGLNPDNKTNAALAALSWPRQALTPIYLWNNTGAVAPGFGGTLVFDNSGGRVVADRDYYLPASGVQVSSSSPFNGTSGVGWGTLANRPTTCTTGVGYWATDQGSWNQSTSNPYGVQQGGADGVLYVATATDTWTLYYTPYTYPHPLQGATALAPGRARPQSF
jgi:hypothetical protein